jgi:predicted small metal-binding protein
MVEFDDKAPLELLELVNKVFAHLDKAHESVDMQKETQDKTEERICGFLKVLGYPADFNPNFCREVVHGDKKTLQHILHQGVESLRAESMNPADLKKEITQLEQEKEQLLTKINLFKNKGNREDFQALLEATSKLRKEQEQDARLNEKERELTQTIEMNEHQLLSIR